MSIVGSLFRLIRGTLPTLAVLLAACSSGSSLPDRTPGPVGWGSLGISGLVAETDSTWFAVQDLKEGTAGPRLLRIAVEGGSFVVSPVSVPGWGISGPSDLESICRLGSGMVLTVEGSPWEGRPSRLYALEVEGERGREVGRWDLPLWADNAPGLVGDQHEGIGCYEGDEVLVLLTERGGSEAYPRSKLRWAFWSLESGLRWTEASVQGLDVPIVLEGGRGVTGLFLHPNGDIWASAAMDSGDYGAFRSVVYRLGRVRPESQVPVELLANPQPRWCLDGVKVEGLASPGAFEGTLAFGSEDEAFGGIFRLLGSERPYPNGC